jgi:tRNA (cmo5U34)-methyltransferase
VKPDRIFQGAAERASDFEFDAEVAAIFDDMLGRSVPFYPQQQSMIAEVAKKFGFRAPPVYDLGCAATTLVEIGRTPGPGAPLVGYDNSPAMLEPCR